MSKRSLLELLADMSAVVEGNPAKAIRMAADEIVSLREQVEKLTKERDEYKSGFEAAASEYRNLKLQMQEIIDVC